MTKLKCPVAVLSLGIASSLCTTTPASAQATERVSVSTGGEQGDGDSHASAVSADGRYVAFTSSATNLVAGDTNGVSDCFIHARLTGTTTRVSVGSSGIQADDDCHYPFAAADGRYVAFSSAATNLVTGDTNGEPDVFVHDLQFGITSRVSVDSSSNQGNGNSGQGNMSADARYVAFSSSATNLVTGDTNGVWDCFVHDRLTGTTTRVSVDSSGNQGDDSSSTPWISADGRYVAFGSDATNFVAGDTGLVWDIFVHDRRTGAITRASVDSSGIQANNGSSQPSVSSDGRYVAFNSSATNLVNGDTNQVPDIFVHDRQTGITTRVSVDSTGNQGNGICGKANISSDGRFVAFDSGATNLVTGDTNGAWDCFVHDRLTGTTGRVSVDSSGHQSDDDTRGSFLSSDGRYVTFDSIATNLVGGDTNDLRDVFARGPLDSLFGDGFESGDTGAWSDATP